MNHKVKSLMPLIANQWFLSPRLLLVNILNNDDGVAATAAVAAASVLSLTRAGC